MSKALTPRPDVPSVRRPGDSASRVVTAASPRAMVEVDESDTDGGAGTSDSTISRDGTASRDSTTSKDSRDITDTAELAARAQRGDRDAAGALLAQLRPQVVRYCRSRLGRVGGSYDAADDVAQEVCLAVLTALPRYRDEGRPFAAFVFGIAAHKVADAQRASIRGAIVVDDLPEQVDRAPGPEESAVHDAEVGVARALLARLPDQAREIILLRVAAGLTAEQTGEVLGMSPGAVRVAQHRALARLRLMAAEVFA